MSTGFDITARRIISGCLIQTLLYFSFDFGIQFKDYSDPITIAIFLIIAYILGIFTSIMDFRFINFWPLKIRSRIYDKLTKFLKTNTDGLEDYMAYNYPFYEGEDDQLYSCLVVEVMLQDPHAHQSNSERFGIYTDNTRAIFTAVALVFIVQLGYSGISAFHTLPTMNWYVVLLEVVIMGLMLISYSYYLKCEIWATWYKWVVMKTDIRTSPVIKGNEDD